MSDIHTTFLCDHADTCDSSDCGHRYFHIITASCFMTCHKKIGSRCIEMKEYDEKMKVKIELTNEDLMI